MEHSTPNPVTPRKEKQKCFGFIKNVVAYEVLNVALVFARQTVAVAE
jgi:hypothetical protein